jgi:hypothetical protein
MQKTILFYSYCHVNEEYKIRLEKQLVLLRREGFIDEWSDRKIMPGETWDEKIKTKMSVADIFLMLISQDYLASEACSKEMEYAIENRRRKTCIPVILKPCTWKDSQLNKIQALPKDGKPIDSWANLDDAWLDIYNSLKEIIIKKRELKVKSEYLDQLEKTDFISSCVGKINLSDVYIYPGLEKYEIDGTDKNIDEEVEKEVLKNGKHTIIRGQELSGRSSFAKALFKAAVGSDYYPVIINGSSIYKSINYDDFLRDAFYKQYNGEYDDFLKLRNKLILVDDYTHKIQLRFLDYLRGNFDRIILFIEDEEYLLYHRDDESLADFAVYRIKTFNHVRQFELVKKWKELDDECKSSAYKLEKETDILESKIDNVILKNHIVPRYPFYILSIIQAFESFMPQNYEITAYGHCYQALIVSFLVKKNINPTELGDCYNYFEELAYYIYKNQQNNSKTISIEQYEEFKVGYKNKFIIKASTISKLEDFEYPIIKINTHVKYEQLYSYYYFVGKYISDKKCNKDVELLCENIYTKDNSNILIFTIHHATNIELLDEIQLHSWIAFEEYKSSKLTRDETEFMDDLLLSLPREIVGDSNIEKNRKDERSKLDQYSSDDENVDVEEDEELIKIDKAMKIMEVLGQIIKNRAGSFEKAKITELLEDVEELGFRLLTYFMDTLKNPELKRWLESRLDTMEENVKSESKHNLSSEEKRNIIERNIQAISLITSIGMLSKVFSTVSSDKLIDTQNDLTVAKDNPAYDFINILFKLAYSEPDFKFIKSQYLKFVETKNRWALKLMAFYLQRYLSTHSIPFRVKQQICDLIGIKYIQEKYL